MLGINLSVGSAPASLWNAGAIRLAVPDALPGRWGCGPYVAAIGGAATHGGYRGAAMPSLLSARIGLPVANFGCRHAGPEAFLRDRGLCAAVARAELCVVEATGLRNITNPFYRVHPRRNDRVLAVEPALKQLYPEIDFAEIAFIGHLMEVLQRAGAERFDRVVGALRAQWQDTTRRLLTQWSCPTVLWWQAGEFAAGGLDADADLLSPLTPEVAVVVAVPAGGEGGPATAARVAAALAQPLSRLAPRTRRS